MQLHILAEKWEVVRKGLESHVAAQVKNKLAFQQL